jgi:hypothetical protein
MNVLVIMMALGGAPSFHAGHAWSAPNCVSALEQAYKPFAARKGAETSGDFNSDGQPDFAMLLDNARTPAISAIGICLSNESRPLLITAPYQTVEIFTKPKGTAYEDYEDETQGTYDRDVISVSDGAWIGASYVLRAGIFVRIVDGD